MSDINLTRASTTTLRNRLDGLNNSPWYLDKATYGGWSNTQIQHVIPVSVAADFDLFLGKVSTASGDTFTFDINSTGNLQVLPNSAEVQTLAAADGHYAAVHRGYDTQHIEYSDNIRSRMAAIESQFNADRLNNSIGDVKAAQLASDRLDALKFEASRFSIGTSVDEVRVFLNNNDPILIQQYNDDLGRAGPRIDVDNFGRPLTPLTSGQKQQLATFQGARYAGIDPVSRIANLGDRIVATETDYRVVDADGNTKFLRSNLSVVSEIDGGLGTVTDPSERFYRFALDAKDLQRVQDFVDAGGLDDLPGVDEVRSGIDEIRSGKAEFIIKGVQGAGVVLGALGLALTASQAAELESSGDVSGANRLWVQYAYGTLFGGGLGAFGALLGSAGGPGGTVAGGALFGGYGGVFGDKIGGRLYDQNSEFYDNVIEIAGAGLSGAEALLAATAAILGNEYDRLVEAGIAPSITNPFGDFQVVEGIPVGEGVTALRIALSGNASIQDRVATLAKYGIDDPYLSFNGLPDGGVTFDVDPLDPDLSITRLHNEDGSLRAVFETHRTTGSVVAKQFENGEQTQFFLFDREGRLQDFIQGVGAGPSQLSQHYIFDDDGVLQSILIRDSNELLLEEFHKADGTLDDVQLLDVAERKLAELLAADGLAAGDATYKVFETQSRAQKLFVSDKLSVIKTEIGEVLKSSVDGGGGPADGIYSYDGVAVIEKQKIGGG